MFGSSNCNQSHLALLIPLPQLHHLALLIPLPSAPKEVIISFGMMDPHHCQPNNRYASTQVYFKYNGIYIVRI